MIFIYLFNLTADLRLYVVKQFVFKQIICITHEYVIEVTDPAKFAFPEVDALQIHIAYLLVQFVSVRAYRKWLKLRYKHAYMNIIKTPQIALHTLYQVS